jgi:hypothetical protein
MANVKYSEFVGSLSVDTIGGSEKIPLVDTLPYYVTPALLLTYMNAAQVAGSVATPTTGDILHGDRAGTIKTFTLDAVSDYALSRAFDSTVVTSITSGDLVVIERSGVAKTITVNNLKTYMWDGMQASVLDISGLTAATLGTSDLFVVCQTTTPKKVTLSALETKLWTDFAVYVAALTENTTVVDGDLFYSLQGGTPKYVTAENMADYFASGVGFDIIDMAWDGALVDPALSTDVLPAQRSGALKTLTVDTMSDYVLTTLGASAAVTPAAASDKFTVFRSSVAKTMDISDVVDYVLTQAWSQTAGGAIVTGDELILGRSNVSKTVTVDALQTFVLVGIQATVLDISGLSTATLGATDEFLVNQSGVAKKTTLTAFETKLNTDFATYVGGLSDTGTLLATDKFYILVSGVAKYATGAEIATYVTTTQWAASAPASVVGTDSFLIDKAGTKNEATVAQLQTYLLIGLQASVLDISGLASATVAGTDNMLICQSGTAKQATVTDVGEVVLAGIGTYTDTLAQGSLQDTDKIIVSQSGVPAMTSLEELADYVQGAGLDPQWTTVSATKYTATPASTSTVTFSDTSDIAVGRAVRYTYGGTTYYGVITAVAANSLMTIAGATLNTGVALTNLEIGTPAQVATMLLSVSGAYADNVEDILAGTSNRYVRWRKSRAYLVSISATHKTADTGAAQPKLNAKIAGNLVSTQDSNAGLQLSTAGTWVDGSAVAISTANYAVAWNDALELRVTAAGTNGNAANVSVSLVFVFA